MLLSRVHALPQARILLELQTPSAPVHLVGGAVRDLLLERPVIELDLVVEGDSLALARALGGALTVHDRFGTCTVVRDGHRYDIARSRRERYPRPGALPLVEDAPLAEDLRRRDFTAGAIALGLSGAATGRLQAVPGAIEDVRARRLRVLHERSFLDDPTRLLRLARYAGRLRFAIEPWTERLARSAAQGGALESVSGPRLGDELRLAAAEPEPLEVFAVLARLGIDRALDAGFGVGDGSAVRALELARGARDSRRDVIVLAAAALGVALGRLRELLDALAFPARERDLILLARSRGPRMAQALASAPGPAQIAAAVSGAPVEAVALAGALGGPRAFAAARRWIDELRHVRLQITGDDLLAAGVPAGPQIAVALRAALRARLEGRAGEREEQLAVALASLRGDSGQEG
jgi:tRNA nucleotidyltransferase (CCA-adding enzyme)